MTPQSPQTPNESVLPIRGRQITWVSFFSGFGVECSETSHAALSVSARKHFLFRRDAVRTFAGHRKWQVITRGRSPAILKCRHSENRNSPWLQGTILDNASYHLAFIFSALLSSHFNPNPEWWPFGIMAGDAPNLSCSSFSLLRFSRIPI